MDDVTAMLHRLQEMAARIEELEQRAPPKPLAASDGALLAVLVPHLADSCGRGHRSFTTAEALTALENAEPSALAGLGGGDSRKRLGRLLARAVGHDIAGLRLRRQGKDSNACVWSLS